MNVRSFLEEVAEDLYQKHERLEELTLVFPNRRAVLYFRKHLSRHLSRPSFSPAMVTIEELISSCSTLKIADKLELIGHLFIAYNDVLRQQPDPQSSPIESLDRFFFWGEMLLRDFDEIDKYLVNSEQLFLDLSHQKELDATFDYLTDEQRKFLQDFWGGFDEHQSVNKKKFLVLWRRLYSVYRNFQERLIAMGLAYEGMQHRAVARDAEKGALSFSGKKSDVVFVGFNALTKAEEVIMAHFVSGGASIHWDLDGYYVNNIEQEAGRFFREYQLHPVLKDTFPPDIPSHFARKISSGASIKLIGAAQPIGQAKAMAQMLKEELDRGALPEETLVVLPDEKLLMPVLHGIASSVEKLNVTMGFPLTSSPMFNFVELVVDLQINQKDNCFNHRQVLALLGHPYVVAADPGSGNAKRKEILKNNWVDIPDEYLRTDVPLHGLIFRKMSDASDVPVAERLIAYIQSMIEEIGSLRSITSLDREFAFHFHTFFNRLRSVLQFTADAVDGRPDEKETQSRTQAQHLKSFLRLFRQLVKSVRIPFAGEPLAGLQVMGVLETRNLDFKNVFVLSLNEGTFPSVSSHGSYVPHSLRKAYGLPTIDHQDAIYSYLFYRVLQRAENVHLFYNSETDVLGQGEMSRYLQQLVFESGLSFERHILHNPLQPKAIQPIVVQKNEAVLQAVSKLNEGSLYFKGISPSALNSYIECRLKFYFRYVAKVKEADIVEEELDARVLGIFLHHVMENFYGRINARKGNTLIETVDLDEFDGAIDGLIDNAFKENYRLDPNRPVVYEGQRLVVREVVKRFAQRIIDMDRRYAPFTIEGLEQEGLTFSMRTERPPFTAVIGGKIDRVDRKENLVRVIDYKTGKDKLEFESISSLFARDKKRNKAAFQTLLYAILYQRNFLANSDNVRLVPGLINRMNLFDEEFAFGLKVGNEQLSDVRALLPEFEHYLKQLFEELYSPEVAFDQTRDVDNCKICPYARICYR